ncbi:MAG: hypothetical protein LQ350_007588 [Teloschistes chrysophthalmus]|nr:MAG: hypothetical protein LQ350_007588 [Niorma chrysophthalma]
MDNSLGRDSETSEYADESSSSEDVSSASQSVSTNDSPNSRKRKRSLDRQSDHRSNRYNIHYSARYLRLLNATISDIRLESLGADAENFYASQIGISTWASEEKELLFRGTALYGRDNLANVAKLIGTKSKLEVQVYLQLLQDSSAKQHMYGRPSTLVGSADISAANEVSADCCVYLEQAADALSTLQRRHEERQEQQRHADLWRLDQDAANWVEKRLREGEKSKAEIHDKLPAAELLHLSHFLKLSEQLFMNSDESDGNWRSYVSSRTDKVSIMYTAFSDLHNLTLSVIKRLIQTSLFFARSRLRASHSRYRHQQAVKRCDVHAALEVLSMKTSARDQWVGVARRCKVKVYDQDVDEIMSYSAVERKLWRRKVAADAKSTSASENEDMDPQAQSSETDSPESCYDAAPASVSNHSGSDPDTVGQSSSGSDWPPKEALFDRETEMYLEYIDQKASRKEELSLWEMLGKKRPPDLSLREPSEVKNPGPYRHDRDDLDHWRGWLDFRPEWEAYPVRGLVGDILENREQALLQSNPSIESTGLRVEVPRGRPRTRQIKAGKPLERKPSVNSDDTSQESIAGGESSDNVSSGRDDSSDSAPEDIATDEHTHDDGYSSENQHQPSGHNDRLTSKHRAGKEIPDSDEGSGTDEDETMEG